TSGSVTSKRTPPQLQAPVSMGLRLQAALEPDAADRGIEQLDRVGGGHRTPRAPQRSRHLDQAARVRAHVEAGVGREHLRRLAIAQLARGLRLDEVVDPGAPAAEVLLVRLDELAPRDRPQQRSRLLAYALGVPEMAGLLERHAPLEPVERRRPPGGERLG